MTAVPEHTIDLSLPPEKRWIKLVRLYKKEISNVVQWYKKQYPLLESAVTRFVISQLLASDSVLHTEEIRSIAGELRIDASIVTLLQFVYEINSCCTSVIAHYQDEDGLLRPHHCRSMDWPLDQLKALTVKLNFVKGSQHLYSAISWAGYVGVLTSLSDQCSIAVNFRKGSGSIMDSISHAAKGFWPIGFLVRELCEREYSYRRVKEALSGTKLISPCYFSVAGREQDEGAILTRSPTSIISTEELADVNYLVQTNRDNVGSSVDSTNILYSKERKAAAKAYLEKETSIIEDGFIDEDTMKELFLVGPILNGSTVYVSYAIPCQGVLNADITKMT